MGSAGDVGLRYFFLWVRLVERVTLDFLVSLLVRWWGVRMGIFFLTVFLIGRG